jgi:membrane-associated phospholipid phosphatase
MPTHPGPPAGDAPLGADEAEVQAGRRFGARALVIFGGVFVTAVLFAIMVSLVVSSSTPLLRLDRSTADRFHRYALSHHGWTSAMRVVSDVGSPGAWWLILGVAAAWLAYRRLWRLAAFVVVAGVGSSLLNHLIKATVDRARPALNDPVAVASGKSFPSGHAQSAIVGYGILLVVFLPVIGRAWRALVVAVAVVLVLLIGLSRIALGVHYLSDVVGAYLVGTVWLAGLTAAFRAWRREARRPPSRSAATADSVP